MISLHPNRTEIAKHFLYTKGYKNCDDKGVVEYVAKYITMYVNSPIVWKYGIRKSHNFEYADWLVLDFDDGFSLDSARAVFCKYTHVIGTTKSHQKPKGSTNKVCDRFRVWLKLDKRCTNLKNYMYTIKKLALEFGADSQAIDGARKFLPCTKLVSYGRGISLEIQTFVEPPRPKVKIYESLPERYIPLFIKDMLEKGVPEGRRNYSCYTISKYLSNNGFKEEEIVNMILSSAVPAENCTTREVRDAVRNGALKV